MSKFDRAEVVKWLEYQDGIIAAELDAMRSEQQRNPSGTIRRYIYMNEIALAYVRAHKKDLRK